MRPLLLLLLMAAPLWADTANLSLSSSGSVRDNGSTSGTIYLGYIDNTFPSSDELYRAFFWWNSGVPSSAAIDSATFGLTLTRQNYQDGDWFSPRGAKINATKATWDSWNGATKYSNLNIDSVSPRYYNLGSNPGNPYTLSGISVARTHYSALRSGDFSLGFNFTDTSGGSGDDSTRCTMSATSVAVTYWNTPALSAPADAASIQTGTATIFSWGTAMANYNNLVFRLQISRASNFSSTVLDTTVSATSRSYTPIDGGAYYWRLRIEDPSEASNVSSWSSTRSFTVTVPPIPDVPTGVDARDGLATGYLRVSWNVAPNATVYDVYRATTNSFGSSSLLASPTSTVYDDTTAAAGTTYYYWVRARNSTGSSAASASDSGYRLNGGANALGLDASGSIWYDHDGDWGADGNPFFGWVDNTFPVDDDHYIAYFWWDGSEIPSGVALDYSTFATLGFNDAGYEDADWANPRAGRIQHSFSTWNGTSGAQARWNLLNNVYATQPHLFEVLTNLAPNPSYSQANISLFRDQLPLLLNGSGFGLAFDVSDTSGGPTDDSTKMRALPGALNTSYYGAPSLTQPASGSSYASGATVSLQWNGVGVFSPSLRHRVQVARDAGFTNVTVNSLTTANSQSVTLVDQGTYHWRVRVEDKDQSGNASAWTATRTFTLSAPASAPAAPVSVLASDVLYTDKVLIAWTGDALASSYQIWRATTNNSATAAQLGTSTVTSFDDTSAAAGTTYYYWVKGVNSVGTSGFSVPDTGTRAQDFGVTLNLAVSAQGAVENDTVFGLSAIGTPRFGLDDGDVWNTLYRAHLWWDVSSVPSTAAIDSAAFTYLGHDPDDFRATNEKQPRARRIGVSKSTFDAGSLTSKFAWLDVALDDENGLYSQATSTGNSYRVYNVSLQRSQLSSLRTDSFFGAAFGSTETDDAIREDTNLFQARGGALTVRYFTTPSQTAPVNAATISGDVPVEFSWNAVLNFGGGTYLRYRLQVAKDSGFSNLVYNNLLQTNSLGIQLPDTQTYHWRLRLEDVVNSANASSWSSERTFTIPLPLPSAPQALTATDGTLPATINLSWAPVLKAATYEVRRNTTANLAGTSLLGTTANTTFDDTSAVTGTRYHYWVRAVNASGVSADATDTGYRGLAAPATLTATDGTQSGAILIGWAAVPNAAGYQVWRNTIPDLNPLTSPVSTVAAGVTSYLDSGALAGQNYFYWVRATDAVALGQFGGPEAGFHGLAPSAAVTATDGTSLSQVTVSWTAVTGATGYEVLRAANSQLSSASVLGTVTGTSYSDTSAAVGTLYHYWVRTKSGANVSNPSAPDTGHRGIAAPTALTASDGSDPGRVTLSWTAVSGATGYVVSRSGAIIGYTNAATTSFNDTTAASATTYNYSVQAFDAVATSTASAINSGFLAPRNLLASDAAHSDKVTLKWDAAATATGYTIWRGTQNNSATASQIGTSSATNYDDATATLGQAYWYWVKATLPAGAVSGFSNGDSGNRASGQTLTLPVLAQGHVRDGGTDGSTPHFGWVDNTWPASDNHYRGYFWWNLSSMPSGVAIERAKVASFGYQKVNYQDSEWSTPTARRLTISKSSFDAAGAAGRWEALAPVEAQSVYFSVPVDQGSPYSIPNVPIPTSDYPLLKPGQSFGVAFTSTDTTGDASADDTYCLASTGGLEVVVHGAPTPVSPASGGSVASGTPIEFQWAPSFARNSRLQYRLQVASDAAFTNLLVNLPTSQILASSPVTVGNGTVLRWRVRVEDVAMSTLSVAQLEDATQNFSAWSSVRTLTLTAPASAPGQVQNVIASDGSFQDSVRLLWEEQALAEFYDIRRATTNNFGSATLVQTVSQGTKRYFDTSAPVGPTLYYWIVARNSAGSASPSAVETGIRGAASSSNYFPQSVASGAPRPASVVLWTRVWDEALPASDRQVSLDVATDSAFTNVVFSRNDLQARTAHDHCVKLTVTGLQPHTTYWYRFRYLKAGAPSPLYSRTGRTRTAPQPDQDVTVRFAFLSCQDFIGKYYNTLHDLTQRHQDTLDFVFWCGDYVYETTGNPEFQASGSERGVTFRHPQEALQLDDYQAARSLTNYRDLYRTYRSDPALQRVHELFPMIITWDDHEFSDDNHGATASYLDEKRSEFDPVRKRNSEQAFLEFQPVENGMDTNGVAVTDANLYPNWAPLYSNWKFGRNCEVILSDFRSYRPDHLIPESAFPGEVILTEAEAKAAFQAVKSYDTATINAQWPTVRQRFDAYDPNFNPESAFGLAVQAAVVYWYQEQEGLSNSEAIGIAKEKVKSGRLSAGFVNLALDLAGFGIASYTESQLASFPRGLSYAYLLKVLPYGPIGARYALIHDFFNCYAWHRFQQSGGATENIYGDRQNQWLHDTLSSSTARWKYMVDSTSFTPMLLDIPTLRRWVDVTIPSLVPASILPLLDNQIILNGDAWDGSPNERNRILDLLGEYHSVVLSGDIHSTWVTRHRSDTGRVIPEFTGTSVSSGTVTAFLDNFTESSPELTGIVDIEAVKDVLKPLFMYSDQFALSDSEIVDCELGSNGYMVVEATAEDMRVLRHEIPAARVGENFYDEQLRETLSGLVNITQHVVKYSGNTLDLGAGTPVSQDEPYNRAPMIAEGSSVTVNLTQNGYPDRFDLALHASDEDGDALTWRLARAPQAGEATLTPASSNLTATVSYQPNRDFAGNDSFTIEVSDPSGATAALRVYANIASAGALDLWRWHYFSALDATGTNPAIWDLTADPDGDGKANLFEFALGGKPNADGEADIIEPGEIIQGANRHFTLRFLRRKDRMATGLSYLVQSSVTPGNWIALNPEDIEQEGATEEVDSEYERITLRFKTPMTQSPRFFRIFIQRSDN